MKSAITYSHSLAPLPQHHEAAQQVIRAIADEKYCSVLGPLFSGKSTVLKLVQDELALAHRYICLKINLYEIDAANQSGFFAGLMSVIAQQIAAGSGTQLPLPVESNISGAVFRSFLYAAAGALNQDIVLLLDHLEAHPNDFIIGLLEALRVAFSEQQTKPHKIFAVVAGALSLVRLTTGVTSPFYNIAHSVLIGDFSEEESEELLMTSLGKQKITRLPEAMNLLLQSTRGDRYLIAELGEACAKSAVDHDGLLTTSIVKRNVQKFLRHRAANYKPLLEAMRLVENDPDLLNCVLILLQNGEASKNQLPLPAMPDIDPLYLTGLVSQVKENHYQLRNEIYRLYLKNRLDPGRVGYLLKLTGRWDQAIDHIATSLKSGDHQYLQDLLDATIYSIYKTEDSRRAAHYLVRGLIDGLGNQHVRVWLIAPDQNTLLLEADVPSSAEDTLETHRTILLSEDRTEAVAFKEKRLIRGQDTPGGICLTMPLIISDDHAVGVVGLCDQNHQETTSERRLREQKIALYLKQAARALQEVLIKQEHNQSIDFKDSQIKEKTRLLTLLNRISNLVLMMDDWEKIYHLILTGMTANFGLGFNRAWLFLCEQQNILRGRMGIGDLSFEVACQTWQRIANLTFDEYLDQLFSGNIEYSALDQPTRNLQVTVSYENKDPFSQAFNEHRIVNWSNNLGASQLPDDFQGQFDVVNALFVPLLAQQKCLGVLVVDNPFSHREFTGVTEEILQTFANIAAAAVTNYYRKETEKNRRALAEAVQNVSNIIGSTEQIEDVLIYILKQMKSVLPFDTASLQLLNEEKNGLPIIASVGFEDPDGLKKICFPLDAKYPNSLVLIDKRPLRFADIRQNFPHFLEPDFQVTEVRGWMGVPLMIGDNAIGVITLDSFTPNLYTDEQENLSMMFARQAALAIEKAQLFEQTRDRGEQLEALDLIALEITSRLETKELLRSIIDKAMELVSGLGGGIYLWDESKQVFRLEASIGLPEHLEGKEFDANSGVVSVIRNTKAPFAISNYRKWAHRQRSFDRYNIYAVVGAPILLNERLLGVIAVHDNQSGSDFNQSDQDQLLRFANHAAIALQNAAAYRAEYEARDYRERLISSSLDGIIVIDKQGGVCVYNQGAANIIGYSREQILLEHTKAEQIFGKRQFSELKREIRKHGKIVNFETTVLDSERQQIPIVLSATRVKSEDGQFTNIVCFFKDLRPLRKAEIELRMMLDTIQTVAQAGNLKQGLTALATSMVKGLNITFCHILILDDDKKLLSVQAACAIARKNGAQVKWKPEIGKTANLGDKLAMRLLLELQEPKVFKRGDIVEDISVLTHISEIVGFEREIGSALVIPLQTSNQTNRVVGVCTLGEERNWERTPFSPEKINLANSVAAQAVALIDRIRAHEATQRRVNQLEKLRKLSDQMVRSAAGKPKDVLNLIAQGACETIDADSAVIYPFHADLQIYDVANIGAYQLLDKSKHFSAKLRQDKSMTQLVMRSKKPIVVDDVSSQWDRDHNLEIWVKDTNFLGREKVKSFVGIGLYVGEEAVGALFINLRQQHLFTQDELDIINIFASQAALTIQQARLFLRGEKEHRVLQVTREITKMLGKADELQHIWTAILEGAINISGAQRGQILIRDIKQNRFRCLLQRGFSSQPEELPKSISQALHNLTLEEQCIVIPSGSSEHHEQGWSELYTSAASLLVTPITLSSPDSRGVVLLESPEAAVFGADDRRLIQALSGFTKIAVESAQYYSEIHKNMGLISGLLEAGQKVTELKNPQVLMQSIVDTVRQTLASDIVTLYTFEEGNEKIGFPPVTSGNLRDLAALRALGFTSKESLVWKRLQAGEACFEDDSIGSRKLTSKNKARKPGTKPFIEREGVVSSAAIPLLFNKERVGILFVNYRDPHPFGNQERNAIQLFATQAAIAIHNARLYAQESKTRKHLEAVYDASKVITESVTLDRKQILMQILVQAVDCVTKVDGPEATIGTIQLLDEQSNDLVFECAYPESEFANLVKTIGHRLPLDKERVQGGRLGITALAALTRTPQLALDLKNNANYIEYHKNTRSELAVPIKDKHGKVIGVLNVESNHENAFDEDDGKSLTRLCDFAVASMDIAERMRRVRRTTSIAVMGAWGAEIVHDLNREVGTIRRAVYKLQRRNDITDDVKKALKDIDTSVDLLALPPIPEKTPQPGDKLDPSATSKIDQIIQEIVREQKARTPQIEILTSLNCGEYFVEMHHRWLHRLLRHLIRNAEHALAVSPRVKRIKISSEIKGGFIEVRVEDTGSGFSKELEPILFEEPIIHGDGREGRGLLIVGFLAERHGGEAGISWNHPEEGACFYFTVPIAHHTTHEYKDSLE